MLQLVGGGLSVTLEASGHLSHATSIPCHLHNSIRALLLTSLKPGETWRSPVVTLPSLLVSTKEGAAGDRMYGISMVWVNPHQARVPTVEEAVKQLTALVSSGPNWPYALMWFDWDINHAPLPREGHLSVLPEGDASRTACGRVSQLEVHQLLHSDSQIIYPLGLNGCKIPLITLCLSPWPMA